MSDWEKTDKPLEFYTELELAEMKVKNQRTSDPWLFLRWFARLFGWR